MLCLALAFQGMILLQVNIDMSCRQMGIAILFFHLQYPHDCSEFQQNSSGCFLYHLSCVYYKYKLSMATADDSIPKRKADELLVKVANTIGTTVGVSPTIWFVSSIFFAQSILIIGSLFVAVYCYSHCERVSKVCKNYFEKECTPYT